MKPTNVSRRTVLATVGSIAAAGSGVALFGGTASAAQVNISASNPAMVSNDRGDISQVTIDPSFRVEWEGLDDAVAKIFYLVEAAIADENGRGPDHPNYTGDGYSPVFRATPWLTGDSPAGLAATGPGTSGYYEVASPLSYVLARDSRYDEADPPRPVPRPIELFNEQGRPDYENAGFSYHDSVNASSYLDGTSMGSAGAAEEKLDLPLVNNFPTVDAGYYGAAGGTSALDNDDDGSVKQTRVFVRYTFELQRPDQSFIDAFDDSLGEGLLSDVRESDVNEENSRIVMNGEDGNYEFESPSGISYDDLQAHASDHVGVMVEEASFLVKAKNLPAGSGVTGKSNAEAN